MQIETHGTEFMSYRIPGLVCTGKGSLIAYYECRKSLDDWAEIVVKIMRSTDNGNTWSESERIVSVGDTVNNPVMFVNGNDLHMLYCINYRRVFHITSVDDGKTWSEPKEVTNFFETVPEPFTVVAIGPGHGIVKKDGTMIAPIWYAFDESDPKAHKPSFVSTVYSKDNGETWLIGDVIKGDFIVNPSECALTELNDGSVMISIRNENAEHLRCHATSFDGYTDWHDFIFDERFPDPICQGSLCRGDGHNFYINCSSKEIRGNLTVKVTEDDFKTFREIHVADKAGYSDIAYKDGYIFVLYEHDDEHPDERWHFSIDIKKFKV